MFVEIKDQYNFSGYKKVTILGFRRVDNMNLLYEDREYELTLADGRIIKQVLKKEE